MISALGLGFGGFLMVAGSILTWRNDPVLGLFDQSGLEFHNLVSGDGKITLVLGSIVVVAFVLGALLRMKVFYGTALLISILVFVLTSYELVYLSTRPGVVGPGFGLYMLLGGAVAAFLAGLGGYLMVADK